MGTPYLLFLDHRAQGSLWAWRRGLVRAAAGEAELARWFAAHPGVRVRLLLHLAEESFAVETLPRLSRRDRAAVLARRAGQLFADASSILTQTLTQTAREERLLWLALPSTALPEWCSTLFRAHRIRLAGLYSIPLLCGPFMADLLSDETAPALCMTLHGTFLRESLIVGRQTLFSRLVPIENPSFATICGEAEKLKRYLENRHRFLREEIQSLHLVTDTPMPGHPPGFRLVTHSPRALAERLNCAVQDSAVRQDSAVHKDCADKTDEADRLFLAYLATRPPKQGFAPPDVLATASGAWRRPLAWMAAAGGALLCVCALSFGFMRREEARTLAHEIARLGTEIASLKAASDQEHARLAQAQERHAMRTRPCPYREALALLGQTLEAHPGVTLNRLSWHCDFPERLALEGGAAAEAFAAFSRGPADGKVRLEILEAPATPPGSAFRARLLWSAPKENRQDQGAKEGG